MKGQWSHIMGGRVVHFVPKGTMVAVCRKGYKHWQSWGRWDACAGCCRWLYRRFARARGTQRTGLVRVLRGQLAMPRKAHQGLLHAG